MNDRQLSPNFWLSEFVRSQTAARRGIDNTPGPEEIECLRVLCEFVLQPLRDALGPVHVTSGYRSPRLNTVIGGSPHSQHCLGQAADIVVSGHSVTDVARWLRDNAHFDQLIHEFGEWVHVSIDTVPRGEVLTATRGPGGETRYLTGLPA